MWKEQGKDSPWNDKHSRKELWEKQAYSFNKRIVRVKSGTDETDKDDYISMMLQRIIVKPDFSVLDIGCGPGTLTIPLAKKAKCVTALDISSNMLKYVRENAEAENLSNINYVNSDWEDAVADVRIGMHDVVVASRCISTENIRETFEKLVSIGRHSVYVTVPIVHLPLDWEIYGVIGRNSTKHPSYIFIINQLYQMGIQANLEILYSRIKVHFSTIDETVADLQWRTTPFTSEEKTRILDYLKPKFEEQGGTFTHEGKSKWALIWWNVKDNGLFKNQS